MAQYTEGRDTIGRLLCPANAQNIVVPEWQRDYSWESEDVEDFWNDMKAFEESHPGDSIKGEEYFLGTIVIVDKKTHLELLDGQQRLATSTIFLSVLRDRIAKYKKDAATRLEQNYIVAIDDPTESQQLALTLSESDRDFFRETIQQPSDNPPQPKLESHRLILQAKQYFERQLKLAEDKLKTQESLYEYCLRVASVLTQYVSVITVTSTDEDTAARVFETLNDRGIGLSTPDLARNLFIRLSAAGDRPNVLACWRDVIELEKRKIDVSEFLRHYWISYEGDVRGRSLYREIRAAAGKKGFQPLALSRRIQSASDTYHDIVTAKHDNAEVQLRLEDLNFLTAKPLRPSVMSILEVVPEADQVRLLDALISMYVRYSVIGRNDRAVMEDELYPLARDFRKSKDVAAAIKILADLTPDDDSFKKSFGSARISTSSVAVYLLRKLEDYGAATGEKLVAGSRRVHLEHIYPKTPQQKWDDHDDYINRIGNLTLLSGSKNSSIKNGDFQTKIVNAYKGSKIGITSDLCTLPAWDQGAIDTRQLEMAELAPKIWPIPS